MPPLKRVNRTSFAVYKVSGLGKQGQTAVDLVVRQVMAEKLDGREILLSPRLDGLARKRRTCYYTSHTV